VVLAVNSSGVYGSRHLKAVLLVAGGVAGSFAFDWLIISRVPALGRIL
jgi:hypothetical protein